MSSLTAPRRLTAVIALACVVTACGSTDRVAQLERENEALRDRLAEATSTTDTLVPGPTSNPPTTRRSTTSLASAVPPASSVTTSARPEPDAVSVLSVVDGDTMRVLYEGAAESLRLIGINSPERNECLYAEAASRLADLVGDGELHLEPDQSDRDQYGRLLRYVFVDDVFVNEMLVREGLAISRHYQPDTARQATLDAAQELAQAEDAGMWNPAACDAAMGFVSPGNASIEIGQIRFNADGDDNHNLNDEWVELNNPGGSDLDLTGWGVKDESASHRYSFPPGFRLGAGATVRLHTGCGSDAGNALYWCNTGSAVWNNSGDTVFVLDPSGNVVVSRSYSG